MNLRIVLPDGNEVIGKCSFATNVVQPRCNTSKVEVESGQAHPKKLLVDGTTLVIACPTDAGPTLLVMKKES